MNDTAIAVIDKMIERLEKQMQSKDNVKERHRIAREIRKLKHKRDFYSTN